MPSGFEPTHNLPPSLSVTSRVYSTSHERMVMWMGMGKGKELECIFIAHIFIQRHINDETGRQSSQNARSLTIQVILLYLCFCSPAKEWNDKEILNWTGRDNVPWYKLYYVFLKILDNNKKKRKWTLKYMCCLRNHFACGFHSLSFYLLFFSFWALLLLLGVIHITRQCFVFSGDGYSKTKTYIAGWNNFLAHSLMETWEISENSIQCASIYMSFNGNIIKADVRSTLWNYL